MRRTKIPISRGSCKTLLDQEPDLPQGTAFGAIGSDCWLDEAGGFFRKASGGQLRDKGSHFFDLAGWIAGERPTEIYAVGACLIEPRFAEYGDVDTAMIVLRMPSGALCHLDFSRRTAYGSDERIEVFGADGKVESRTPIPVDVALYRSGGIGQKGLHQHWYDRIAGTYPAQLAAFVKALNDPNSDSPQLPDAMVAEVIADAGMRSLDANRPVPIGYQFDD